MLCAQSVCRDSVSCPPDKHTCEQLEKILEVTGKPSGEDVEAMKSPFAGTMLDSIAATRQIPLVETCPNASPQALDLMQQVRPKQKELHYAVRLLQIAAVCIVSLRRSSTASF